MHVSDEKLQTNLTNKIPTTTNLAFFGGAFNPPTFAHLEIAKSLILDGHVQRVSFLPAALHKFKGELPFFELRTKLLQLLFRNAPDTCKWRLDVRSWELNNLAGTTEGLVNILRSHEGINRPTLIIGGDNFANLDKWHNWQNLISSTNLVVLNREKLSVDVLKSRPFYDEERHRIIHADIPHISSTMLRVAIKNEKWNVAATMTPANVLDEIRQDEDYLNYLGAI